ncbi:hypothetical protein Poli38472_000769 [Pythium oligandrum]|uniref:Dol-P-Glc:Glc(2)Man(9)GlcNAc(2)-PP-Dol alpha-1,2-glucosyltransferase n=1 Tax=Pythium oligandrum TaxID=41045 RepID=A0A8K1CCJ0_PYTOL|nr:hypothetical protein Poli38472_000769 [Pythium oligandrum]|eukprot:TMW60727.1 hypothetical protein Poli38472_000769 [Pythium oligandrum]
MMTVGTTLAVALAYALVLERVNHVVSEPYMDEIFHVPQAQKYCQGRFDEWDPKITTFPGVYFVGVAFARLYQWLGLSDTGSFCSISVLRSVNVAFAAGNTWLIIRLRQLLMPTDSNLLLHALMITAFPVQFFFSFVYYTDAGAVFFVLLMYFLALRANLVVRPVSPVGLITSAMAGAAAVLFRQTNIVWVLFVAGTTLVRYVERSQGNVIYGSTKQDAKLGSTFVVRNSFFQVAINFVKAIFSDLLPLLSLLWPFIALVLGFIVFLVVNGGIVVGDKSNHEASIHGAQLLYFVFVASTGFGLSLFQPSQVLRFADSTRRQAKSMGGLVFLATIVGVVIAIIHFLSPVHKFMLADNRHYTFYVWRKFFLKHRLAKFIPSLLYMFQGWRCWTELRRTRTPLWLFIYIIAVMIVLVPTPLVEPRYYLLPFVLMHLHTSRQSKWHLLLVIAAYSVVNAATIYIFLYRPYTWVDGTIARFMW